MPCSWPLSITYMHHEDLLDLVLTLWREDGGGVLWWAYISLDMYKVHTFSITT
jgi:hypothetical protein